MVRIRSAVLALASARVRAKGLGQALLQLFQSNTWLDNVLRSLLMSIRCASLVSLLIASASLPFAYISAPLPGKLQPLSGGSLDQPQQNVESQPRFAPSSYRNDTRVQFKNVSPPWRTPTGNTVAVVLNWSRFENVRRIASVLCKPELDPIIEQVLVWNNNPKPLTFLVRHMVALS
jgi:hypothetical protein